MPIYIYIYNFNFLILQNNVEVQESDHFSDNISTAIDPGLDEGQTSSESGILEIQGRDMNLPSDTQYEVPENLEEV